jgi:pimeloyl-ACP methyl ester carboxylesterase
MTQEYGMEQQVHQRKLGIRVVRYSLGGIAVLIAFLFVAAGVSSAFNAWARRRALVVAGVPGKLYTVDGRRMHLFCTGQGSPTIVLEAGLGDDSMIWGEVQPVLARETQVCSYDRAGFGWSEPRPGVRDSNAIASELHTLLTEAGITGPIILMGHSIAGIHMRAYIARYPENVKGIVFVDGSTPLQDDRMGAPFREVEKKLYGQMPWQRFLITIGVPRLLGQCSQVFPGLEAYAAWIKADLCNPQQITTSQAEIAGIQASGEETVHLGPFGDLPILIFSQDPEKTMPGLPPALAPQVSAIWNGMQEDIKKLSTRSRRIIAKGSGHYVEIERAELVNRGVENFLQVVRGQAAPLAPYGSTVKE